MKSIIFFKTQFIFFAFDFAPSKDGATIMGDIILTEICL